MQGFTVAMHTAHLCSLLCCGASLQFRAANWPELKRKRNKKKEGGDENSEQNHCRIEGLWNVWMCRAASKQQKPEDLLVGWFMWFPPGNMKCILKLTAKQYSQPQQVWGCQFTEGQKLTSGLHHGAVLLQPVKGEKPCTPKPSCSSLPAFHVKDTHQLILKEVTRAPKSLNVTKSITGNL